MNEEEPTVSICIPLWEKDEYFDKLIKSIKEHDAGISYEICIGEGHNSTSVNRNKSIRIAKSDYICQMDGDAEIIQDGWLSKMFETLKSDDKIAIVGCIVELPNGKTDHPGTILITDKEIVNKKIELLFKRLDEINLLDVLKKRVYGIHIIIPYEENKDKLDGKIYGVNQCSGVCFLFDRRKIGEFLETYVKAGWEDADIMARTLSIGYRIVVDGRVRVKHPNHIRTEEEQNWRDKKDSERGFSSINFNDYVLKWGLL